jgi:hypothetical protein
MFGLEGIRIISFNHFLMGPLGVQYLGDLGADVISVEPIEGAFQRKWGGIDSLTVDGHTMLHLLGNRNKRSVALNLKDPRGIDIVRKLIATADVMTENFRPGVMAKLGLGYDAVKAIKPDIIYAAGSGFGADGPYVNRPGQDLIIQAMSGIAEITGKRGDGQERSRPRCDQSSQGCEPRNGGHDRCMHLRLHAARPLWRATRSGDRQRRHASPALRDGGFSRPGRGRRGGALLDDGQAGGLDPMRAHAGQPE